MKRSSTALRQWLQLRRALYYTKPATPSSRANDFLAVSSATLFTLPTSHNNPSHTRRPFHSTQSQHAQRRKARPAPAVARKRETVESYQISGVPGWVNKEGIWLTSLNLSVETEFKDWIRKHMEMAEHHYDRAINDGYLSSAISLATFRDVFAKLCREAWFTRPSGQSIRAISVDVDAVFRIGYIVSTMDMSLREWVVSACSMAKARMAVVLVAGRQINWNKMPVRNEWVREVEALAKKGYPPAMLLQAKILGLRNQYNEAFTLLENEVLPFLSPTRQSPVFFQDILLGGQFESPWRLYALLLARYDSQYNCKESRARSDEALRIAALEYQDADALIEYASVMMNENNLDMYEECMSKAATAGKSNACLFLANFYYLTFHGKYPTRGERTKQLNGQVPESTPKTGSKSPDPTPTTTPSPGSKTVVSSAYKWITSFFQQAMAREDYRNLAADWYHLAYWHGEAKAAFMVALIWRENGEKVKGRIFLDYAAKLDQDADFAGKMQALRTHWYDDDFHPTLPRKMLEVR